MTLLADRPGSQCNAPEPGRAVCMDALWENNDAVAAQLVPAGDGTYARPLRSQVRFLERGGERLRKGLVPHNNSNKFKNNNWAALQRPIFLFFQSIRVHWPALFRASAALAVSGEL